MTLNEMTRDVWCVVESNGEIEDEGFIPTLYDPNDEDMHTSLRPGERAVRVRIVVDDVKPENKQTDRKAKT